MGSKRTSPDQIAQVAALRAAGWTLACIVQETGLSTSTVQRVLRQHPVGKGEAQQDLIDLARRELVERFTKEEALQVLYANLVADTAAHIALARTRAAEAMEHLVPTDTKSAALCMRGIAAHAVATKAHTDTLRHLLPEQQVTEELPALEVIEMTAEDVAEIRAQQAREDSILTGHASDID